MNDMTFEGIITKADFHPMADPVKSTIQLWVNYDVTEESIIEVDGLIEELSKKFEISIGSDKEWNLSSLTGRHCKVIRNAQGYHFVSFL